MNCCDGAVELAKIDWAQVFHRFWRRKRLQYQTPEETCAKCIASTD